MNNSNVRKVLLFGDENCGLIHNLSIGFNELGNYKVTSAVCKYDSFFLKHRYDYNFQKPTRGTGNRYLSKLIHLVRLLLWKTRFSLFEQFRYYNYDLYIFTWQTLKDNYADLIRLRKKNKDIVFLFIGSNVRWIEAFRQEFPGNPYKGHMEDTWADKIKLTRMGELYSSAIFSVPDQSSLFVRGYYHMFMPVEVKGITFSPQDRVKPLIIHAPSKRDIKGTAIIMQAMDRLRAEGLAFDFLLLENLDNATVLKKLEEADILVDQLYLNGPGTLSTEAMAAGCAVATRYLKEYDLTKDVPMLYVDEKNVYDGLKQLITDRDLRKNLMIGGRKYVETHNAILSITKKIVDSIQRDTARDYDYRPHFFKTSFILPPAYTYPAEIAGLNSQVLEKYSE